MDPSSPAAERAPAVWNLPQRIAFRFGFLVAALMIYPFPIGRVPRTEWLFEILTTPWSWLVSWFGEAVLGLDEPSTAMNGSGDTTWAYVQLLVIAILAVVGTGVWSYLDRRRLAYTRLASGALVVLRYFLAFTLLTYAFAKLYQFSPPGPGRLDQRIGDMSPMGMLWTFMGSSPPYSLFGGFAEGLGGVLLLWRRTATIGALVATATMTNVVALNFCYDVPVKLYSLQLLACAIVIVLPNARRLLAVALGRAAAEVPPRRRMSRRWERARLVAKVLLIGSAAYSLYAQVDMARAFMPPRNELHGIWVVDRYVADGVERPPLATDAERWRKLHIAQRGASVKLMTSEARIPFPAKIDPVRHTIETRLDDQEEVWTYVKTDGDLPTLTIAGKFRGKHLYVTLTREPDPLLVTRGFHWINETPFNK
jgi:uncharacterized membrane protein YphA (DoxX/SURF4 family)